VKRLWIPFVLSALMLPVIWYLVLNGHHLWGGLAMAFLFAADTALFYSRRTGDSSPPGAVPRRRSRHRRTLVFLYGIGAVAFLFAFANEPKVLAIGIAFSILLWIGRTIHTRSSL
jgi:hypothetical protein